MVRKKYAGNLRHYLPKWELITQNKTILEWIKGIRLNFIVKPRRFSKRRQLLNSKEIKLYQEAINDLLKIGAVSVTLPSRNNFLSPYFLTKKANGKTRFILNLKKLNSHILAPHFKLEDSRMVCKLLSKNYYVSNIDLKDAYFLLSIHKHYKRFLCFEFQNTHYHFNCLPFGLNIAPYIFTKIFKPIVSFLRRKQIFLVVYLDDLLIIAKDKYKCQLDTNTVTKLLKSLGFLINTEKSNLVPSQEIKFLGFIYNTHNMTMSLPQDKIISLRNIIQKISKKSQIKIRTFASLVGSLAAACPVIKYGWVHIKLLERDKYLNLHNNNSNYDKHMLISKESKHELNWWLKHITNVQDIKPKSFTIEIFTDASTSGWGASCDGKNIHGFWDEHEQSMHINYLEIKAAFYGLKSFSKNKSNIRILLRIDNVTAISCINKGGSIKFKKLNQATRLLWDWCESNNLLVFASYISSIENINADAASRCLSIESEYELNNKMFQNIVDTFGKPDIDLFATKLNTKCRKYVSWYPDPNSISTDAFTLKWSNLTFYAFPPFQIIARVLEKVKEDKATGVIVVPHWPNQPWYPLFNELLNCTPIIFPPSKDLLISPFRGKHPLCNSLFLVAGKISGWSS